jgi:hypothetical protein
MALFIERLGKVQKDREFIQKIFLKEKQERYMSISLFSCSSRTLELNPTIL